MKIKDFVIERINDLVTCFPSMKVSYQIDNYSNSNYIKVLPKEEFNSNLEYQKYETNLIIEFINKFPFEEIVFVSDDSLIEVTEPIYEVEGKLFNQNDLFWNTEIWSNNVDLDFSLTLNKSATEIAENYNSLSDILKTFNDQVRIQPIFEKPVIVKQAGENSYALAA